MRYLLLILCFFSVSSYANHCNSGASHNGPDRQADHKGYMKSDDTAKIEKEVKSKPSKSLSISDNDEESKS